MLFDNVRADALRSGELPPGLTTNEERQLQKTLKPLRGLTEEPGCDLRVVSFPLPDIVFAMPEEAVRRLLRSRRLPPERFPGWDRILSLFRSTGRKAGSKRFLLEELGLDAVINEKTFVPELLARCTPRARPGKELERAMAEAMTPATIRR